MWIAEKMNQESVNVKNKYEKCISCWILLRQANFCSWNLNDRKYYPILIFPLINSAIKLLDFNFKHITNAYRLFYLSFELLLELLLINKQNAKFIVNTNERQRRCAFTLSISISVAETKKSKKTWRSHFNSLFRLTATCGMHIKAQSNNKTMSERNS